MRLEINAKTNIPQVTIDFIEVINTRGERITIGWDSYEVSWKDGFSAYYRGVSFGGEYANGRLSELNGLKEIESIQLYSEKGYKKNSFFDIINMFFDDDGDQMEAVKPKIKEVLFEYC